MKISLDTSQKEAFRLLTNYFAARHAKTLARDEPAYLRAEFGSWFSFADEENAKGEVEARVARENSGSFVHLDFDFTKEYSLGFVAAILGALSCHVIVSGLLRGLAILGILSLAESWVTVANLLIGLLTVMLFVSALALESHAVSRTRKRFIEELGMFMQP